MPTRCPPIAALRTAARQHCAESDERPSSKVWVAYRHRLVQARSCGVVVGEPEQVSHVDESSMPTGVDGLLVSGLRALEVTFTAQQVAQVCQGLHVSRLGLAPEQRGKRPESGVRHRRVTCERVANQISERIRSIMCIGIACQRSQNLFQLTRPGPVTEDKPEQLAADCRWLVRIFHRPGGPQVGAEYPDSSLDAVGCMLRQRHWALSHARHPTRV
jgi:hypothetical protein